MTEIDSPQILALKERYQSSLDEKIQVISEYVLAIENDGSSLEQVVELRGFLHKLAGSSGMYGYNDISASSRRALEVADRVEDSSQIGELLLLTRKVISLLQSHC